MGARHGGTRSAARTGLRLIAALSLIIGSLGSAPIVFAGTALEVTAADDAKQYDGTTDATQALFDLSLNASGLAAGDTVTCTQTFDVATTAASQTLIGSCSVTDGTGANVTGNYDLSYLPGTGTISQRDLTVTGATDTKQYDGTTDPTQALFDLSSTAVGLLAGDTVVCAQTFDLATTAASQTLVGACSVTDGSNADITDQYAITKDPGSGTITQRQITVTATGDQKTYDGTRAPSAPSVVPTVTSLTQVLPEHNLVCSQLFDTDTTAATYTQGSCSITDGTTGDDMTDQYDITYDTSTGQIDQLPITVQAVGETKTYDGTKTSLLPSYVLTPTVGLLVPGQTLVCTQEFDLKTTAATQTVITGCSVTDGTGVDVTANYLITTDPSTGTITQRAIEITADDDTKTYDGTTAPTAGKEPNLTSGTVVPGQNLVCSQVFDVATTDATYTRATCSVTDGTGADVTANYDITYVDGVGHIYPAATSVIYTGATYLLGATGGINTNLTAAFTADLPCWPGMIVNIKATNLQTGAVPANGTGTSADVGSTRTYSLGASALPTGIYAIEVLFTPTAANTCLPSSDSAVLVIAGAGDTANGGGWYRTTNKDSDATTGSPKVNFGFTIQRTTKAIKGTTNSLITYKGQLLWVNQGAWRFKAGLNSSTVVSNTGGYVSGDAVAPYGTFPCPPLTLDGTTFTPATCGSLNGTGKLEIWATDHWAPYAGDFAFTANTYDGGVTQICKTSGRKTTCSYVDRPDWFGMQFLSLPSRMIRESLPLALKGGSVKASAVPKY